eukprot:11221612-Lingulodinium_polyedra.AAC.1
MIRPARQYYQHKTTNTQRQGLSGWRIAVVTGDPVQEGHSVLVKGPRPDLFEHSSRSARYRRAACPRATTICKGRR